MSTSELDKLLGWKSGPEVIEREARAWTRTFLNILNADHEDDKDYTGLATFAISTPDLVVDNSTSWKVWAFGRTVSLVYSALPREGWVWCYLSQKLDSYLCRLLVWLSLVVLDFARTCYKERLPAPELDTAVALQMGRNLSSRYPRLMGQYKLIERLNRDDFFVQFFRFMWVLVQNVVSVVLQSGLYRWDLKEIEGDAQKREVNVFAPDQLAEVQRLKAQPSAKCDSILFQDLVNNNWQLAVACLGNSTKYDYIMMLPLFVDLLSSMPDMTEAACLYVASIAPAIKYLLQFLQEHFVKDEKAEVNAELVAQLAELGKSLPEPTDPERIKFLSDIDYSKMELIIQSSVTGYKPDYSALRFLTPNIAKTDMAAEAKLEQKRTKELQKQQENEAEKLEQSRHEEELEKIAQQTFEEQEHQQQPKKGEQGKDVFVTLLTDTIGLRPVFDVGEEKLTKKIKKVRDGPKYPNCPAVPGKFVLFHHTGFETELPVLVLHLYLFNEFDFAKQQQQQRWEGRVAEFLSNIDNFIEPQFRRSLLEQIVPIMVRSLLVELSTLSTLPTPLVADEPCLRYLTKVAADHVTNPRTRAFVSFRQMIDNFVNFYLFLSFMHTLQDNAMQPIQPEVDSDLNAVLNDLEDASVHQTYMLSFEIPALLQQFEQFGDFDDGYRVPEHLNDLFTADSAILAAWCVANSELQHKQLVSRYGEAVAMFMILMDYAKDRYTLSRIVQFLEKKDMLKHYHRLNRYCRYVVVLNYNSHIAQLQEAYAFAAGTDTGRKLEPFSKFTALKTHVMKRAHLLVSQITGTIISDDFAQNLERAYDTRNLPQGYQKWQLQYQHNETQSLYRYGEQGAMLLFHNRKTLSGVVPNPHDSIVARWSHPVFHSSPSDSDDTVVLHPVDWYSVMIVFVASALNSLLAFIDEGNISQEEQKQYWKLVNQIKSLQLFVDDAKDMSVDTVRQNVEKGVDRCRRTDDQKLLRALVNDTDDRQFFVRLVNLFVMRSIPLLRRPTLVPLQHPSSKHDVLLYDTRNTLRSETAEFELLLPAGGHHALEQELVQLGVAVRRDLDVDKYIKILDDGQAEFLLKVPEMRLPTTALRFEHVDMQTNNDLGLDDELRNVLSEMLDYYNMYPGVLTHVEQ